ncbi:MAG: selenium cofactor biosynthesis protein YqeC [Wenzhouxiangellaceae bacterium]|nr:selenium cofactor biosynthesis protein YqeC [Wenzhouxiangellaceae bacterium]
MSALLAALDLPRGIVCAIGAGGKKSLLHAIAYDWPGTLAITTTVHSTRPPRWTGIEVHTDEPQALLAAATQAGAARKLGLYRPGVKRGRVAGLSPDEIERLWASGRFEQVLVKADGARMRGIKAPKPGEPVLADATALVLVVVSVAVLGQPLNEETAHRPERIAALTGLAPGQLIEPEHLARLFAVEGGLLQGTAGLPLRIVLNQVDDAARAELARRSAAAILEQVPRIDRVLLTRLGPGHDPARRHIEIVRRAAVP